MKAKHRILLLFTAWFVCTGQLAFAVSNYEVLESPWVVPEFSLSDQQGDAVDRDLFSGKWSIVFIGFTSCPDVCPYTLASLEAIRAQLSTRVMPDNLPQIIFLAVDPDRDKKVLKDYLAYFHGDFIGITGSKAQIDNLVGGLGAFYRFDNKELEPQHYSVTHSSALSVINPQARVVARMTPPFRAQEAADFVFRLIKGLAVDE